MDAKPPSDDPGMVEERLWSPRSSRARAGDVPILKTFRIPKTFLSDARSPLFWEICGCCPTRGPPFLSDARSPPRLRPMHARNSRTMGTRRQGRVQTDLARADLWKHGRAMNRPVESRCLNSLVRTSRELRLTPDLDVFAWICERWVVDGCSGDRKVWFTLRDIATDLYGSDPHSKPGGKESRLIQNAFTRLMTIVVTIEDYDGFEGRYVPGVVTQDHVIDRVTTARGKWTRDPRKLGAMRDRTVKIKLPRWLCDELVAGNVTYLDYKRLRQLDGLAKRLWVYLQAENYSDAGNGASVNAIGLGNPALRSLGLGHYALTPEQEPDKRKRADARYNARRKLKHAAERVMKVDPRYSLKVARLGRGSFQLRVNRLSHERLQQELSAIEKAREYLRAPDAPPTPDETAKLPPPPPGAGGKFEQRFRAQSDSA